MKRKRTYRVTVDGFPAFTIKRAHATKKEKIESKYCTNCGNTTEATTLQFIKNIFFVMHRAGPFRSKQVEPPMSDVFFKKKGSESIDIKCSLHNAPTPFSDTFKYPPFFCFLNYNSSGKKKPPRLHARGVCFTVSLLPRCVYLLLLFFFFLFFLDVCAREAHTSDKDFFISGIGRALCESRPLFEFARRGCSRMHDQDQRSPISSFFVLSSEQVTHEVVPWSSEGGGFF